VNWRRIRSDFIYRIAFGTSALALAAHSLTMWLLRVPIGIVALYALVPFGQWFRSRHQRGLPMWRFWA
jgi:hypothetical protein